MVWLDVTGYQLFPIILNHTASMRAYWILSLFSILMSAGLLMVILGQRREMDMISQKSEAFSMMAEKVYNKLQYEANFKESLQKLVTQGETVIKDLETEVANLGPDVEKKNKDTEACQAEMKTIKEELDSKESSNKETTEALSAETGTWQKEIDSLKGQLAEPSKVCNYLIEGKTAPELCGNKTSQN